MQSFNSEKNSMEGRFETIFSHVNEGILIANAQGEILVVNPKVEMLFGYNDQELKGKKVEQLIPTRFREKHVGYRERYTEAPVKRPMGKNLTLFASRKDGSEFPVEISLSYYTAEDGVYVIAFIIDITERFEQQEKIKKINQELTQLNETLERKVYERTLVLKEALSSLEESRNELSRALDKEKELNEMKSRFISMASHEFRTPLSSVLSSVSLIAKYNKEEDQEKREKHIHRIKKAVHNLTEILNDFLSIGKLEEGRVKANLIEHDICEIVQDVVAEMNGLVRAGQVIEVNHTGACAFVLDGQMFRNILINLLANAIKFSPENTTIHLNTKLDEQGLHLEVIDHGLGISEEDQKHLFTRFFRGKNVTNIEGTGLGLNIVAKYLELLNGTIQCKSQLDKGTTFTIFIPYQNQLQETEG
ncbi:MAG TPA: PAS domain-containing sensor histidine kinase [Flavobacteriales bacterium]